MSDALKILTWNVNSVRARLDLLLGYLEDVEPDIVCLQETKVQNNLFPRVPFMEMGYDVQLHGTKGYAGVATLSRKKVDNVQFGFREAPADRHPRILALDVAGVRLYNVYVPNGTALDSDAYPYKLEWYGRLRSEIESVLSSGTEVVICGDFNVIPDDRDVWDPAAWDGQLQCTEDERKALKALQGQELRDCFRKHSEEGGVYSYFDYQRNCWPLRHGIRIDHFYASPGMYAACTQVVHDLEPRGWEGTSDHVPVWATFER